MEILKNEIIRLVEEVGFEIEEKKGNWFFFTNGRQRLGGMRVMVKSIQFNIDTRKDSPTSYKLTRFTDLKKQTSNNPNYFNYHDAFEIRLKTMEDVKRAMGYVYILLQRPADVRIKKGGNE